MHESVHSGTRRNALRHSVTPRFVAPNKTFDGVYMRPNQDNKGEVPATGSPTLCPDIWITGQPVDPSSLITADSYAKTSGSAITTGTGGTNYIYVRGRNGATGAQSRTVQLYFAPSAVIQWPGMWVNNKIPTDQGTLITNINNLAPGAIGVAKDVFQWNNVQPPPAGSDHYCLFAQMNDAKNSNPFPDITSQIDMASLVTNNLGWGWRNTQEVPGSAATFSYQMGLSVPMNMPPAQYFVYINNVGFLNWSVSFQCSQVDAKGKPIALVQTQLKQEGQLSGVVCDLQPGFNASVTVNMYQNGAGAATPGSRVSLNCNYGAGSSAEIERAVREGLIDWRFERYFREVIAPDFPGIDPKPWLLLGGQHGVVTRASASRTS